VAREFTFKRGENLTCFRNSSGAAHYPDLAGVPGESRNARHRDLTGVRPNPTAQQVAVM